MGFFDGIVNTLGKVAGVAGSVISNTPGLGTVAAPLGAGLSSLGSLVQGEEARKSQESINSQQIQNARWLQQNAQDFNARESEKSWLRNQQAVLQAQNFNAQQVEKERSWLEKMWNASNEYNSPVNQLSLLQKAGYNPNLFSPSISEAGRSFNSPSASSPGSLGSSPVSSPIASVGTLGNPSLVASQIQAQTRLADAQADKLRSDSELNQTNSERLKALLGGELQLQHSRFLLDVENANLSKAQQRSLLKGCEKMDSDIALAQQSIQKMQSEIALNIQELKNRGLEGEKLQIEVENYEKRLQAEYYNILSETAKNYANVRLSDAEIRHIASQIKLEGLQAGVLSLDVDFAQRTHESKIKATIYGNNQDVSDIKFDTNLWNEDATLWQNAVGIGRWFTRGIGRMMSGNVSFHKNVK